MGYIVIGAGSMAEVVARAIPDGVAAFVVDDAFWRLGQTLAGLRVFPLSATVTWEHKGHFSLVNGIVSPDRAELCFLLLDAGFSFVPVVHPAATVHAGAQIGPGAFVNMGACVDLGARLGFCALVNRGATVGHRCSVAEYATIGPGAHLAGGSRVGAGATVGMGALLLENRIVGAGAFLGAGAVALKDVPPGETWAGVPARRLQK